MVRILGMETYILPLGCLHRAKCEFNTGRLRAGQEMNELCEVGRYSGNRERDSVLWQPLLSLISLCISLNMSVVKVNNDVLLLFKRSP